MAVVFNDTDLLEKYKDNFAERLSNVGLYFCPYDIYSKTKQYVADDIVYYKNPKTRLFKFYKSKSSNINTPPIENVNDWEEYDVLNIRTYITDEEILQAIKENKNKIHYSIIATEDKDIIEEALFLLISYNFDINKAQYGGLTQLVSGQSAEGYSVSFDNSKRTDDISLLLQSTFGIQYKKLIDACVVPLIGVKVGDY